MTSYYSLKRNDQDVVLKQFHALLAIFLSCEHFKSQLCNAVNCGDHIPGVSVQDLSEAAMGPTREHRRSKSGIAQIRLIIGIKYNNRRRESHVLVWARVCCRLRSGSTAVQSAGARPRAGRACGKAFSVLFDRASGDAPQFQYFALTIEHTRLQDT